MHVNVKCCVAALLASVMFGGSAHAWGDNAHKIICAIAFELAEPHTQDEIQDLIALDPKYSSFSDSCVFPDHPRIRAPEHFVNLARDSNGLTSDQCPGTDRCVLSAIQDDSKVLSSKTVSDVDRLIALKSLGHWVGDIHQPLHVSFADDRGGILGMKEQHRRLCLVADDISSAARYRRATQKRSLRLLIHLGQSWAMQAQRQRPLVQSSDEVAGRSSTGPRPYSNRTPNARTA
jgi:S1/P1 Nuclease